MPHPPPVQRVIDAFERLAPADLATLDSLYSPDVRFKDPFNDVQGLPAVRRVFEHMFVALASPRFHILDVVASGDRCFLTWDFRFRLRRWRQDEQCIHGGSFLVFAADGRIAVHRDYWDAAEELYEKLPVLGTLMRWLKRRASR